jgi:shikimate kinase
MMGSGKTSVGSRVATEMGMPFVDLDDEIVAHAGRTVAEIFAVEGEEGFRRHEAEALERVAGAAAVVATGGGAVLCPRNVDLMRRGGLVIWLRAEASVLASRVGGGEGRPLLAAGATEAIERLTAARADRYREAAHIVIETDRRDVDEVAAEVIGAWNGS